MLDDLVARINAYHPNGGGPHISGGEVSLQPIYNVLMDNGRGDVLWNVLQEPTAPELRELRRPGPHDDPRVVGLRRLPEPHDPAADRRVVQRRPRRHPAGAGLDGATTR